LTAEGFGALRDRIEIDFTDIDFFALVGPTGAGKSTVIDAICFALYGTIPRYADDRVVTSVISAQATEARVELEFSCGVDRYRVMRLARRAKSGNKVQLDRIDEHDSVVETISASARDVKEAIARIVGLTFDQFTKCVTLPQGAFSDFLHETERARNDLLFHLLDLGVYEQIAYLAGQQASAFETEIKVAEQTLAHLGVVDDQALAVAEARHAELQEVFAATEELVAHDDALAAQIVSSERAAESARSTSRALEAIRVPEELADVVARHGEMLAALTAAQELTTSARTRLDLLESELAGHVGSDALERMCERLDERDSISAELERARGAATAAETELRHAIDAERAAIASEHDARAARELLVQVHAAHALAAQLVAGEPCPVCTQTVTALPTRHAPAALLAADDDIERAAVAHAEATAQRTKVDRRHAASQSEVDGLSKRAESLTLTLADQPDRAELLEQLAAARAIESDLAAARAAEVSARRAEAETQRACTASAKTLDTHHHAFHTQRDTLARFGVEAIPSPAGDLGADWSALVVFAQGQLDAIREVEREAQVTAATARRRRAEVVAPLRDRMMPLGVEISSEATLAEARQAVRDASAEARFSHLQMVQAREQMAELTVRRDDAAREAVVARDLHSHLGTKRFKSWLVRRVVDDLAARASERLADLSSGRYSLVVNDKGDFGVEDHANGGEVRSARSLSGGETFQASLALALALAEQVAEFSPQGATSLESIFLDEGFGTLDPEALDVVADTIEQLGSEARMVGIVTHVAALADRVPTRFRVRNDGRTATITRESA
jgi:exonuclease SbcC